VLGHHADPVISAFLARKCSEPEMRLKIAVVVNRVLGETQMLRSVLDELADCADRVPGYEEAKACLTVRPIAPLWRKCNEAAA